jgi:hypothetical protein
MNNQQAIALAQGLTKILGASLAAHGATKAAAIVNGEDVAGVVIALAGLAWSHFYHGDTPTLNRAMHTVANAPLAPATIAATLEAAIDNANQPPKP